MRLSRRGRSRRHFQHLADIVHGRDFSAERSRPLHDRGDEVGVRRLRHFHIGIIAEPDGGVPAFLDDLLGL